MQILKIKMTIMLYIFDGKNNLLIDKCFFINDTIYIICITEKMKKKMHDKLTIIIV
jgi:hypothetical protein